MAPKGLCAKLVFLFKIINSASNTLNNPESFLYEFFYTTESLL